MPSHKSAKPRHRVLRDWWEEGRAEFPGGPRTDFPQPGKVTPRGRGQPSKVQAGTWEDDDQLGIDVQRIVGQRDERAEVDVEAYGELKRLADRVLGRRLTSKEERILRRLCYGTGDGESAQPRRTRGRPPMHDDEPRRAEKPSVIARQILVWRHNLTDPDVRRMQRSLRAGRPAVKMIFR